MAAPFPAAAAHPGETDEVLRDALGNALGGLRTTYTDASTSMLVAATPIGRTAWYHGNEMPYLQRACVRSTACSPATVNVTVTWHHGCWTWDF